MDNYQDCFGEWLRNAFERHQARPALIDDEQQTSYSGLASAEAALRLVLLQAGVRAGHVVSVPIDRSLSKTELDFLLNVLDVNLNSAIAIVKRLKPNLRAGRGNIFLVGSTCGLENEGANIPAYVSSKFGLRGLTHALRESFRKSSVRVTCISPGSMATDDPSTTNWGKGLPADASLDKLRSAFRAHRKIFAAPALK